MPGRETDDSHTTRLPTPRGAQAPSPQPPFPRWVFSDTISSRGTGDGVGGGDSPRATDPLRKEPGSVCVPQSQTETGPLSAHQAGRSTPWAGGARAQSAESVLLWRRPLSGWVRSAQTQVAPRRRPNDGAAQAFGVTPGRPSSCPGSATWKSYTLILVVSLTVH